MINLSSCQRTILLACAATIALAGCREEKRTQDRAPLQVVGRSAPEATAAKATKAPSSAPAAHETRPGASMPAAHPPMPGRGGSGAGGGNAALPPGHPPIGDQTGGPGMGQQAGGTALKAKGPGSVAELERVQKAFSSPKDKERFAKAFTLVFARDRSARDPRAAKQILKDLLQAHPKVAALYRVLGYAHVDDGFDAEKAIQMYKTAVELDPEYGEAHYALAFMFGMKDPSKGKAHFRKAMELGVPDGRSIGHRFYPAEDAPAKEAPAKEAPPHP
jgi:hypothetical protein